METKKILIIGSGIAGLSAGIYAQKNGFDTTIVEMHERAGGQLTAWDRGNYRFDYCLHWLIGTDHGVYNDMWWETGAINEDVEIINHKAFVHMEDEEHGEFYIYNDLEEWKSYLIKMAPEDEKGITKMIGMMRKGDRVDQFEDPPGMRTFSDYLKSLWQMGSFFTTMLKYKNESSKELLDSLRISNPHLRFFLENLYSTPDFSALGFILMFGWFNAKNAGYLKGGSLEMSKRMAKKFQSEGGKFLFNSRVKEIIVKDDEAEGIILENGNKIFADHIISACDGRTVLFNMLKGKYLNEQLKYAYENWPLLTPMVLVSFGVNKVIQPKCHTTNYFVKEPISVGKTKITRYQIMHRTSYDPTFAPDHKSTIQLYFDSPWEIWKDLKADAYLDEKEAVRKKAIELIEKHYPGVGEKIEEIDIATPKTTVRYTGVWNGAYEGFTPRGNIMEALPMKLDGLDRFTMVGQWLFPGGGLPPSALSGKWAIQMICKDEKRKFEIT
ncbi:phytoene desaturase family protein [Poritiphilus flavus]|uniref:NAD(P)-binding protein n=1 Tax=Poritiphilus flavus TaxID=2697053 RepID=A0A6L9EG49_9FLAO|nr:NAD(P)/FAD-dependent oxidoreductase [Poritiphilus flavus]NAS13727.1 NAD(P)-binding protein [Poritiphilus flavus]